MNGSSSSTRLATVTPNTWLNISWAACGKCMADRAGASTDTPKDHAFTYSEKLDRLASKLADRRHSEGRDHSCTESAR